ncbi:hypothetical protein OG401_41195 [Kitasatospora purpeofusca]|uniref:hypothetical protein n=1 Tax=Kitasatospora purpeofusca TaxID=67352 RepID=UPI00225586A4|nr:hypothetical protein [Kitasatospora purpeofusca]MCX4690637.1 hypothetical protein [Kitasatospora purpeofusca]
MLTSSERLRCIAYMEAVLLEDGPGRQVLRTDAPGERPLAAVLAEYGEAIVQAVTVASFGIHDGLGPEQLLAATDRMRADAGARYAAVLGESLRLWAATATGAALDDLARIVASCVMSSDPSLTPEDLPDLLAQLRAAEHPRPSDG